MTEAICQFCVEGQIPGETGSQVVECNYCHGTGLDPLREEVAKKLYQQRWLQGQPFWEESLLKDIFRNYAAQIIPLIEKRVTEEKEVKPDPLLLTNEEMYHLVFEDDGTENPSWVESGLTGMFYEVMAKSAKAQLDKAIPLIEKRVREEEIAARQALMDNHRKIIYSQTAKWEALLKDARKEIEALKGEEGK